MKNPREFAPIVRPKMSRLRYDRGGNDTQRNHRSEEERSVRCRLRQGAVHQPCAPAEENPEDLKKPSTDPVAELGHFGGQFTYSN